MATVLRKKRGAESALGEEDNSCPICMEGTKDDRFRFPCSHWICSPCNEKMVARNFLACPTCRTPRAGVSQSQVESANHARAARDAVQEGGQTLVLRAGGQHLEVIFFPDQSDGFNPFAALGAPAPHPRDSAADDHLHQQVAEAAMAVQSVLPHLRESSGSMLRLQGPMRELVDRLLRPGTVEEFLAQREVVRNHRRHTRSRRRGTDNQR